MNLSSGQIKGIAIGAAVLGIGYLLWKAKDTIVNTVTTTLNPASDKNLAYRGVNAVGEAVTGDSGFSLGSYLFDVFNPTAANYDPNANTYRPQITPDPTPGFNPYAPGGTRSDYVTAVAPDSPFDYSLDAYLRRNGAFPTYSPSGGVQSEERANFYFQ